MIPLRFFPIAYAWLTAFTTSLATSVLPQFPKPGAIKCTTNDKGDYIVTADCIDPLYDSPIIDTETHETKPDPHFKISGHFNNTNIGFSVYLTPKSQWQGRFFQVVYPSQNSTADGNTIAFGVESGGYTVQASGSIGYRADAAVAKLSRQIARGYYNISSGQIYGYIYGGSGGSLKVIGAAENTHGVWDGCLALIQATPMSIPYNGGIRALGGLVLAPHSKELIDAIQPGGSGDPSSVLDDVELSVLKETEALGVPVRGWEDWSSIVGNRTQQWQTLKDIAVPIIQSMDPTYADDFWNKDGYAGSESSTLGERFLAALVCFNSTITTAVAGENGFTSEFVLNSIPGNTTDVVGLGFSVMVNNTSHHFSGKLVVQTRTVYILAGAANTTLQSLVPGTRIQVDNRWYLAAHTYHRHQLPPPESGFYGHNYLRDEHGVPLYPQRNVLVGPLISRSTTGGATHTGNITMKMIAMDNLLDFDAFPWHADWYKNQIDKAKGDLRDHYRLYYSDNADHVMGSGVVQPPYTSRVVDFTGLYQQHLRDLSAWVERQINPPAPTKYAISNGQIKVPTSASKRRGIQPVVELGVANSKRAQARIGERIVFRAKIEVPHGVGKIVALEWDPLGVGEYVKQGIEVGRQVDVRLVHVYKSLVCTLLVCEPHRIGKGTPRRVLVWLGTWIVLGWL